MIPLILPLRFSLILVIYNKLVFPVLCLRVCFVLRRLMVQRAFLFDFIPHLVYQIIVQEFVERYIFCGNVTKAVAGIKSYKKSQWYKLECMRTWEAFIIILLPYGRNCLTVRCCIRMKQLWNYIHRVFRMDLITSQKSIDKPGRMSMKNRFSQLFVILACLLTINNKTHQYVDSR
jgi:hypothetical protein